MTSYIPLTTPKRKESDPSDESQYIAVASLKRKESDTAQVTETKPIDGGTAIFPIDRSRDFDRRWDLDGDTDYIETTSVGVTTNTDGRVFSGGTDKLNMLGVRDMENKTRLKSVGIFRLAAILFFMGYGGSYGVEGETKLVKDAILY
jgi:hypothetical protein